MKANGIWIIYSIVNKELITFHTGLCGDTARVKFEVIKSEHLSWDIKMDFLDFDRTALP